MKFINNLMKKQEENEVDLLSVPFTDLGIRSAIRPKIIKLKRMVNRMMPIF